MNGPKKEKNLKSNSKDIAHSATKALLSAIPGIGGPAAELFSAIIIPPLTKRRDEWIRSIAEGLENLEKRFDNFEIKYLSKNEMFLTTTMHAYQMVIRNHQKEKLEALRNAVLNTALEKDLEEDIQLIFLNFIDTLTPMQIKILHLFKNPKQWAKMNNKEFPKSWHMGTPAQVLEYAYPQLKGKKSLYDILVKDLADKGLFSIDSLHDAVNYNELISTKITPLGKQFLDFIQSPIDNKL